LIFLSGGTSESLRVERLLARAGLRMVVSQATEVDMDHLDSPLVEVRRGRLDANGFCSLFLERGVRAVVDASHPFAERLREELEEACERSGLPRLRVERPPSSVEGVIFATDHARAAKLAFSRGRPVFLATGSRSLALYVRQARRSQIPFRARLVPSKESLQVCKEAGVEVAEAIWERGPFGLERNLEQFQGYGVLVAKDSGEGSGTAERLEAARRLEMDVIMVRRPNPVRESVWDDVEILRWVDSTYGVLVRDPAD